MLQNYKPENKELADLAKKYKEPLMQVEKLMIPGFSNEDFYLMFKTCYAQFWKDLENVYHHCKNSDRVWVEKGKDPVYNCPEPQEFLERLSRMYIERTRERLEQGGEYLSDDDRKGIIAELSLAGKSEIERKKSKRKQDIYEYLASDVFVSHNLEDDDAFLTQLQNTVLNKFYTFLNTGSLTGSGATWQDALAKAQGLVLNKFATMQKDVTAVVGFANILDAFDYLGSADITIQTQFGLTYIKDFLGYSTLFLLPSNRIARNTVIATPVENIDLYYIDPSDSEFARLGLEYTTQGETNLIGFHAQGNYHTAVGESYALMGMALWAEYLDGIAVVSIDGAGGATGATGATGA
jgi:hypothetical protein